MLRHRGRCGSDFCFQYSQTVRRACFFILGRRRGNNNIARRIRRCTADLRHTVSGHRILHLNEQFRSGRHIHLRTAYKISAGQADRPEHHRSDRGRPDGRRFAFQTFLCFRSQHGRNRLIGNAEDLIESNFDFAVTTESSRRFHLGNFPVSDGSFRQNQNIIDKHVFRHRKPNHVAFLTDSRTDVLCQRNFEHGPRRHFYPFQFIVFAPIYRVFQIFDTCPQRSRLERTEHRPFQSSRNLDNRAIRYLILQLPLQRVQPNRQRRFRRIVLDDIVIQRFHLLCQSRFAECAAVHIMLQLVQPLGQRPRHRLSVQCRFQYIRLLRQRQVRRRSRPCQCRRQCGDPYPLFHHILLYTKESHRP